MIFGWISNLQNSTDSKLLFEFLFFLQLRIKNEELQHSKDECTILTKKLEKTRTVNNR